VNFIELAKQEMPEKLVLCATGALASSIGARGTVVGIRLFWPSRSLAAFGPDRPASPLEVHKRRYSGRSVRGSLTLRATTSGGGSARRPSPLPRERMVFRKVNLTEHFARNGPPPRLSFHKVVPQHGAESDGHDMGLRADAGLFRNLR
jgi:hypothetical protein